LATIAATLPTIVPFGSRSYADVQVAFDWDHRIPSRALLVRIFATWDAGSARHVRAALNAADAAIARDNLYPEFDLPDYSDVDAHEVYAGVLLPDGVEIADFQLVSDWRRQVPMEAAEPAVEAVARSSAFAALRTRPSPEGLGSPTVAGWAPPFAAGGDRWAVEVWVVTQFDGREGRARAFYVDPIDGTITREDETQLRLA
jgi:hypothetical protein